MAVTEAPEILAEVVKTPFGVGEFAAGGEFEEDGLDDAVLVFGWTIGDTRHETGDAEGDEEMLIVDVIDGEHGSAFEEVAGGDRLEAEGLKGNALRRVGLPGGAGRERKEEGETESERTNSGGAMRCGSGQRGEHRERGLALTVSYLDETREGRQG